MRLLPQNKNPARCRLAVMATALPLSLLGLAAPAGAAVLISQVYGGGGATTGSPSYKADFVELRNTGSAAASLAGMSLQYGSATGTGNWSAAPLSGSIAAGGYLLVQVSTGSLGANLPTPDLVTGVALNMGASNGKVALVSATGALSGACPTANVLDLLGYGSANCSEGGSAATVLSNTMAALRSGAGCTDSNNNGADFTVGTPNPRNAATVAASCGVVEPPPPPPVGQTAAIHQIQGSGATSPLLGQAVITSGVVTRLTSTGFYLQSLVPDSDPATSEGLFVFTNSAPTVATGQLVQLTGTVSEFATGGSTVTQLGGISSLQTLGSGYTVVPTPVTLPVDGGLERHEGMLVTVSGPLTVSQTFFQARFGQLTLAAGSRLETPTNRFRPGSQATALATDNAARRLVLDDGSSQQNPNPTPYTGPNGSLRAGDTLNALTGVIDYGPSTTNASGPGDYRLHPTVAPTYTLSNARTAAPPTVGGNLKVASFNVLNYFTTFTDGNTAGGQIGQGCSLDGNVSAGNCRGAGNATEFGRQRAKIIEAMLAIDADVLGLMEIQNNGSVAAQNLVDGLNARLGAGTYAVVPDPAAGTGSDAIKVAMIYRPARLARSGAALSDLHAVNNRPTLAQTFVLANGEKFSLLVNHLKSKGSCPSTGADTDQGDGQGCWNATRLAQAQQLRNFVAQVQAASGSNDVLLVGDFNAYGREDPIDALTGAGFVDQLARFSPLAYSYIFDGAAGRLDHAISSATLSARVASAQAWHINADESVAHDYNLEFKQPACAACAPDPYAVTPYRSSDHDPVVVGLNLYKTVTAAPGSTTLVGTAGDDILVSGAGRRSLTGGAGRDWFVFVAGFAGGQTITDFQPGVDAISLTAVMQGLGITTADAIGQGYASCVAMGNDAMIRIDPDAGGPAAPRAMLLIKNQGCAVLNNGNFVF